MAKNTATANWTGTLKEGKGHLALDSGAYEGDFTFKSRFEDGEDAMTNPEELIAAAHAGCFTMQLSNMLHGEGLEPESVETSAQVGIRNLDGKPTIATSALTCTVTASGADEAKVRELAETAKSECIVTRALAGIPEVTLELTVEG